MVFGQSNKNKTISYDHKKTTADAVVAAAMVFVLKKNHFHHILFHNNGIPYLQKTTTTKYDYLSLPFFIYYIS